MTLLLLAGRRKDERERDEARREQDELREDFRTLFAACVSEFEYGRGLPEWLQEIKARHPWMKEW